MAIKNIIYIFILVFYAFPATYYYNDDASGGNDGSSPSNGFQNLTTLNASSLTGGDTLIICAEGDTNTITYLWQINKTGSAGNRITVLPCTDNGYDGYTLFNNGIQHTIGQGYFNYLGTANRKFIVKNSDGNGVYLYNIKNFTLSNLIVDSCGNATNQHGLSIQSCHGILVDSCDITHPFSDGINLNSQPDIDSQYTDLVVTNCNIITPGDDGIQCLGGTTVKNCYIYSDPAWRDVVGHPDGVQVNPNGKYVIVDGCELVNFIQGIFFEKFLTPCKVVNNILRLDSLQNYTAIKGIFIGTNYDSSITDTMVISNNVVTDYSCFYAVMIYSYPEPVSSGLNLSPSGQLIFKNNILYNNKLHISIGPDDSNFVVENNLIYTDGSYTCYTTDGDTVEASCGSQTPTGFGKWVDPLLDTDYTLQDGSPAIYSGDNLYTYFTTDKNNEIRSNSGKWDIGAYTYIYDSAGWPDTLRYGRNGLHAVLDTSGNYVVCGAFPYDCILYLEITDDTLGSITLLDSNVNVVAGTIDSVSKEGVTETDYYRTTVRTR